MKILKKISGRGLVISLYFDSKDHINAFCDITEITDLLVANPLEYFKEGDVVLGRVLSYDNTLGKYVVSLRESLVKEADFKIISSGNTNQAAGLLNKSKIDLRNKLYKYGAQSILEKNQVVIGYVTSSSEKGIFIKLAKDCSVRANMNEISDHRSFAPHKQINENQLVLVRIISINGDKENKDSTKVKINVSLRESVIKYNLTLKLGSINNNNFYLCLITGEKRKNFNKLQ